MRISDTNIIEQEVTLESIHDAFKERFHKYLSKVFVSDDPYFYIDSFRRNYIYADTNRLVKKYFPNPYDYRNIRSILRDIEDAVIYKPNILHPDDITHINEVIKKSKTLQNELTYLFDTAICNAEKDLARQNLMEQYGICGKNKEYLESLYEKIRCAMKKCTVTENTVTRCVFNLIPNADEVIRDIIRLVFTSYISNPIEGRNILAVHLITRLDDGKYNYAQQFDCWGEIRCALCVHQLSRNTDFDNMIEIILDDNNANDGFGWEECTFKDYDMDTYNFIECLIRIMCEHINEKDVERYKRRAKKNIDNKISTERF